ncbi:MAG: hypothetical protein OEZ02_08910 [Anaerolineae bacterium]|nr:hypothetical protein [Anaerolineae bacterium]
MKKSIIAIAITVIAAATLGAVGVAYAQSALQDGPGFGMLGNGGFGPHGGQGDHEEGPLHELMQANLAEALGIPVEDLSARHEAGKSFIEIAASLGFDAEQARDLMLTARSKTLEQAVSEGLITQEQADQMYAHGGPMGSGDCPMGDHPEGFGPGGPRGKGNSNR